jgi:hypothetical protein
MPLASSEGGTERGIVLLFPQQVLDSTSTSMLMIGQILGVFTKNGEQMITKSE